MMMIGCSEVVDVPTMGSYLGGDWPRVDCPHLQPGLIPFNTITGIASLAGANITIPSGN